VVALKAVAGPAEDRRMEAARRIAWGHFLVGLGLLLRRASLPAAIATMALLVLAGFPPLGLELSPAWVLAVPLAVLLVARVGAVGIAAAGWLVFPPEHRALLSELSSRPSDLGLEDLEPEKARPGGEVEPLFR
jgi:hypothetical protein